MQIKRTLLALIFSSAAICAQQPTSSTPPTRETYLKLAGEVENALHTDVLNVWFPRSVDKQHGGFHSHFARDWQVLPSDGKFSVFQGRMTWVASQVVLREPQMKDAFVPIVRHGVDYLAKCDVGQAVRRLLLGPRR